MRDPEPPPGFVRFTVERSTVTCAIHVADPLRRALRDGSLYSYAERHRLARALAGRGVVYAVPLPDETERVVVRHNHHGGLLAAVRGDVFLPPTRAPRELQISERLRQHGVPTPRMLGYVIYPALAGLRRVDVMTREVPSAVDLSVSLQSTDPDERVRALTVTARLITALSSLGARHHDLNAKNVLVRHSDDVAREALVLDVDRVTFAEGVDGVEGAREQNLARLLRSARKWQLHHGARVTDGELETFASLVRESRGLRFNTSS